MEDIYDITDSYLNSFVTVFSDFAYIVHGTLLLLVSAVLFVLSLNLYKRIRRKFPISVNCWFCNQYSKVPYDFANSWDCPHCQQYNGFSKDGGYNKVIQKQYHAKLNEDIFNTLKPAFCDKKNSPQGNGLCKLCNINQQLKIQQLALFAPIDENNYEQEIESYKEKLEKAYQLCSKCETTLRETLEKQEYNLLQNRLNNQKQTSPKKLGTTKNLDVKQVLHKLRKGSFLGLRWTKMIVSVLLLTALILNFETEYQLSYLTLPDSIVFKSFIKGLLIYTQEISNLGRELSFLGFFCTLLCLSERQTKTENISLLIWGALHVLLWSDLTPFQVLMSGVCVFFNAKTLKRREIYFNKKSLPKKSNFQPEKRVFTDAFSFAGSDRSMFTPRIDLLEEKKQDEEVKKPPTPKNGNEIEPTLQEESEIKVEPATVKPSSSVFSKAFLSTLEESKVGEEPTTGPLDDVYNNLNGLHLGGKPKKQNKPSNFLFANHNFEKSSIIKPAKLIKNLSSSWNGTESNESASRSSTPSSGYSSQKADKVEPNRYDFPKTMSPLSVNPFTRYDYYDPAHGFYNNYNCFTPGFVPFQQFTGPMGHTTIYTCTRPTNFPFPFPWQDFSAQKFSPASPRISDASDCENLFQNMSKSFEKSQKWFRLKTISYYFSICLNVITLLGLMYFVSAGIISVEWKLPKFNFFL